MPEPIDRLDEADAEINDVPTNTWKLTIVVAGVKAMIESARALRDIAKSLDLIGEILDAVAHEPVQVKKVR